MSSTRALHVVRPEQGVDVAGAEDAVRQLLIALGEDPATDHLRDTPRRVALAYEELLTPRAFTPTTFPNDEGYDELVLARDIPFHSLSEHHLFPFQGVAHVGYLPGERILGLCRCGAPVPPARARSPRRSTASCVMTRARGPSSSPSLRARNDAPRPAEVGGRAGQASRVSSTVTDDSWDAPPL